MGAKKVGHCELWFKIYFLLQICTWVPTKNLSLCSYVRHWTRAQKEAQPDPYCPHFLPTSIFLQSDRDLLNGNFHICLLSTSMPSPDLCLKLWVFNKNRLEKETYVGTLKQTITMLFVLSPREQKEKNLNFFLMSEEGWRKERLTSGQVLALNTLHNQLETLC